MFSVEIEGRIVACPSTWKKAKSKAKALRSRTGHKVIARRAARPARAKGYRTVVREHPATAKVYA
jgi:hypothetical protein